MWFNHMMKQDVGQRPSLPATEYPADPPTPIVRPAMLHVWSELSFVHWPYDPDVVQALLPEPLKVDVIDGAAWVGLVPFHCTIHPPQVPRIPWVSSFEEMNVRTYVRGPGGVPGVWFITLDAARLGAVLFARYGYGLNYFWSKMDFSRVGNVITYSSRRRWPQPSDATGTLALEVGAPIPDDDTTSLERFLTRRWTFFGGIGRQRRFRGDIEHEPWQLERARLLHCDPGLVRACGLPYPEGDPIVHHAGAVHVRMSAREHLT